MAKKQEKIQLPYNAISRSHRRAKMSSGGSAGKQRGKRKTWGQRPSEIIRDGRKTGAFEENRYVGPTISRPTSKWKSGHTVKGPRASKA